MFKNQLIKSVALPTAQPGLLKQNQIFKVK